MCHHHRVYSPPVRDERDTTDAAAPASNPKLRASDAERERVAEDLRRHAAEGRLAVDELEERLTAAFSARTRGELEPLLGDLPRAPHRSRTLQRRRAGHVPPAVVVALALVTIWALTGMGYFWPVWPFIGLFFWGRASCRHAARGAGRPEPGGAAGL